MLGNSPASAYSEIGILGHNTQNGSAFNMSANQKASSPVTVPVGGVWAKTFYLWMSAATTGQKLIPVLYSGSGASSDTLFAQAQEYTFVSTFSSVATQIGPINWKADGSALFIPAGTYLLGAIVNGSMSFRNFDGAVANAKRASDTYSDGPAATYGTITTFNATLAMWIPYSIGGP
jgi:hypothetical protein